MENNENSIYDLALAFINSTRRHIFLTGKAGTGKTFFLKQIKKRTTKRTIIVAPTGVAAINAQGVTLHSLFNLPLVPYIPPRENIVETIRFDAAKRLLLEELELLIIDEVSMLRADVLDAVDSILRRVRRQQEVVFGGLQVLFIGDLFQLAPIVKDDDWQELKPYYKSSFFVDARSYAQAQPICLTLQKVYRQQNTEFIDLLNNIRIGKNDDQVLAQLNSFYYPGSSDTYGNTILLTTHNRLADQINTSNLQSLPGQPYVSDAIITGDFDEASFPTDKTLLLKPGAQVMVIKNDKGVDKRYFNGKIAVIEKIGEEYITVRFHNGEQLELEKEVWRKFEYKYQASQDNIQQNEVGSFQQFPVRLAWAITIHKSQGLTFDHAIIDAAEAFLPGHVYVALSRLSSPAGLKLKSPVPAGAISVHPRILEFSSESLSQDQIDTIYKDERKKYLQEQILNEFDFTTLGEHFQVQQKKFEGKNVYHQLAQHLQTLLAYSQRFSEELKSLFSEGKSENRAKLKERVIAATQYFSNQIEKQFISPLGMERDRVKAFLLQKSYFQSLRLTMTLFERKKKSLDSALQLVDALNGGKAGNHQQVEQKKKKIKPIKNLPNSTPGVESDASELLSLTLFKKGKNVKEIAEIRRLTRDTIEHHLSTFLRTGEIEITELVDPDLLKKILDEIQTENNPSILSIKTKVPECSFGQIKAAMAFRQLSHPHQEGTGMKAQSI